MPLVDGPNQMYCTGLYFCTMKSGKVTSTASVKPLSPSQQVMNTSLMPWLARLKHTLAWERGAFLFGDPHTEDVLDPVHVQSDGYIGGCVHHLAHRHGL